MDSQLLCARLDHINNQKSSLSVEDMLILVTEDQPNLNRGFFSRLFTVHVPEKWIFYSETSEDIAISLRYIALIENVFIHNYAGHAKSYAWFEQCVLFRLKYQLTFKLNGLNSQQFKQIQVSTNLQLAKEILNILFEREPNEITHVALAQTYKRMHSYTDAIRIYEQYFERYNYIEHLYFEYIECLVHRKNIIYNKDLGDFSCLQYSLYLLSKIKKVQDKNTYESLINKIITELMPEKILTTRAESTNFFADMGRGLNYFSKRLGTELGGRESEIPYSKGIIASAPKLLKNPEIIDILEKDKKAQKILEKILNDKGAKLTASLGASAYSIGLIWDYAHIDSSVLDALTFASKGNPENFNTLQSISEEAIEKTGAVTRLTGYVAEQQVAMNLQSQGYVVELPSTANQVGYDLIVDGTPIQVKCSMDANYVLSHFDKYPDIPVIVNSELAEQLGSHPMVMIDPALSYEAVKETTNLSLEQIAEFDNLSDILPVPVLTIAFASYRNFGELNSGKIDGKQYFENVGKETVAIAGSAMVGKVILGTVGGLVAGPVGIALAGGLGAYIGGVAGSTGANSLNREELCNQRDIVVSLLIQFSSWFTQNLLNHRVKVLQNQLEKFEYYLSNDCETYIELSSTLFSYQFEMYSRALDLQHWLMHKNQQGNEMEKVQAGWVALSESSNFMSVELRNKVAKINSALDKYKQIANPESVVQQSLQLKHV